MKKYFLLVVFAILTASVFPIACGKIYLIYSYSNSTVYTYNPFIQSYFLSPYHPPQGHNDAGYGGSGISKVFHSGTYGTGGYYFYRGKERKEYKRFN